MSIIKISPKGLVTGTWRTKKQVWRLYKRAMQVRNRRRGYSRGFHVN